MLCDDTGFSSGQVGCLTTKDDDADPSEDMEKFVKYTHAVFYKALNRQLYKMVRNCAGCTVQLPKIQVNMLVLMSWITWCRVSSQSLLNRML